MLINAKCSKCLNYPCICEIPGPCSICGKDDGSECMSYNEGWIRTEACWVRRCNQLRRRAEAAEAIVRWFEDDHDEHHCLEKPDDLERLYEELDAAMLGTASSA